MKIIYAYFWRDDAGGYFRYEGEARVEDSAVIVEIPKGHFERMVGGVSLWEEKEES